MIRMISGSFYLGMVLSVNSCTNEKSQSLIERNSHNSVKIDSLKESIKDDLSSCFLKLSDPIIDVEDTFFINYYSNVVIEYRIEHSQITDSVRIHRLFIFEKSTDKPLFDTESGFEIDPRLGKEICTAALKKLKESTLHCNDEKVQSWGRVAMRVRYKSPK